MSLRPARDVSLGRCLVACFSSVKNHNVSGPHLFSSFTTRKRNLFDTPGTVLQRANKSLCNSSQFRTLFLSHRFIKIRLSRQEPVSIEFLTICQIPKFPKSVTYRGSPESRVMSPESYVTHEGHTLIRDNTKSDSRVHLYSR